MSVSSCLLAVALALPGLPPASEEAETPPPNSPEEPMAEAFSLDRTAEALDRVALAWTRERKCGTCHTNYPFLLARPTLGDSDAAREIRSFFEGRVEGWDGDDPAAKPRWDTEVVATAAALALNDAATTGTLHAATRRALDRIWTLQRPDGAFDWLKCDWPPFEHDDYFGAVFAALGVGHAPEGYARGDTAREGVAKLVGYLRATPPPDLHHRAFLLWASTRLDGLMTADERAETIEALRALQREDGGWSLPNLGDWPRRDGSANPQGGPGDGYATGLVVLVLRRAGVPADDPAVRRGADWLRANQRASGRWFTRSLNNDKAHYIANAGTAFAAMALGAGGAAGAASP